MKTLHVILAIIAIGYIAGSFEGLKNPGKLASIVIAVLLFNEYYKKEGFETTEEDKYKF
jgi:hypothetical protein